MTPREAFLGRRGRPGGRGGWSRGRRVARRLPAGDPNVLPGERLTAETLEYIKEAIEPGERRAGATASSDDPRGLRVGGRPARKHLSAGERG